MSEESGLRLYSLGIVVEDKPVGSDIIMVSPIEVLNIQPNGSIKDAQTKFEGTLKNSSGKNFATELKSKNYFRATWISFGASNRITAPDVVKNETVILFKFGDVDKYYWTTIFREVELRRQETVLYGFSNLKSGISAFDKSTSYWLEVDTRKKTIKFHTAMNDGEFTEYDIIFDTKQGNVLFTDKRGNYIYLDSPKDTVTINMLKDIVGVAGQDINVKAGRDIIANAGKNIEATAGSNIIAKAGTNIEAQAGSNITAKAGTNIEAQAGSVVTIKAPNINLIGNVNIQGNITTSGSSGGSGQFKVKGQMNIEGPVNIEGSSNTQGPVTVQGDVNVSGTIMDGGGNSNHHSH